MTHRTRPMALRDRVTDHALVRWMERMLGMDFDQVREQILPATLIPTVEAIGTGKIPIGDGLVLVVVDRRVVTVSENAPPSPRKLRPHCATRKGRR